ncbi:hypothetical protein [Georgenia sp. H159]|uniref:variant leucine-rich repeat-containing protein n=1 Tax=Georgenia sp. H159 TaxID=3076115 RepID=UPI002D787F72|nr:hypothetical protein [Georgenia sp. H159]
MSEEFTAYQATNPATAPDVLARLAAARPELRPLVAANPAAPRPVVEWLATLGDHGVDAALARRRPAPPTAGQQPVGYPPPVGSPVAPAASPTGPPPGSSVPPGPGPRPDVGPGPYAEPGPRSFTAPGSYAAPGRPTPDPYAARGSTPDPYAARPYGWDANPYAAPGAYPGAGGPAPVVGDPRDAYGYRLPEPGRRTGLVVAIVVGAVLLVGALVFAASTIVGSLSVGGSYGDDPRLDGLWDACADGDGQACDTLYMESPAGSEYEEFGDTCGGRYEPQQVWCAEVM